MSLPIPDAVPPEFATVRTERYLGIGDYAMVGNMRTVALVGVDGGLDYMCYPRFDSPAVFARLLDADKGGHWHIRPAAATTKKQQYLPNSNVLSTRFLSGTGVGELIDYMHVPEESKRAKPLLPWLVRHVSMRRGKLRFRVEVFPAFDYGRTAFETAVEHDYEGPPVAESAALAKCISEADRTTRAGRSRVIFRVDPHEGREFSQLDLRFVVFCKDRESLLSSDMQQQQQQQQYNHNGVELPPFELEWHVEHRPGMCGPGVWAEFDLRECQEIVFILREVPKKWDPMACFFLTKQYMDDPPLTKKLIDSLFEQTHSFWSSWISKSTYKGRWREMVHRSALALKMLTYEPTGAVVAAPTFGLPEEIGGNRNWDYRYTWIRDASFTIYAFVRLGLTGEAEDYMKFIEQQCAQVNPDGSLQIMYGIDGRRDLPELELAHFDGYRGSKPVRIGNSAHEHLQLDIYGALLDAVYLYNKYRSPIGFDFWVKLRKLVNYVCENWNRPDMSIWETRGEMRHFIYSKIMCWVAIDRGLRLVEKRALPCPDRERWLRVRDEIYEEIMSRGWCTKRRCFMQSYEGETPHNPVLDAAVLVMPMFFFISPTDPRILSTIKRIMLPHERGGLMANNLMVYRYDHDEYDDGLKGSEGCFSLCTFWLIEALTRAGHYKRPDLLEQAHALFDQFISHGNHVGFFSEEIDKSGEPLGNFPQAFTHIALISAAFNLDRALV